MKASEKCTEMIKGFESLRLKAYLCPSGIPTIGWGHTKGVTMGCRITRQQAEEFLEEDIRIIEEGISKAVCVPFTQNQFDALVSFTFNIRGGVSRLKESTLLRKLNKMDYYGAADEFRKWNRALGRKGIMETLDGLTERREKERKLFLNEM